jgi:hypothetical protein
MEGGMSGITLHPKYGVNPTLGVCFWCGEEDGTIGLLGLNRGREAKKHTIISFEPCAKCKENMAKGITVIEADQGNSGSPGEIAPGTYPTGRWAVVRRDAQFWECVNEPMRSDIMKKGKVFLPRELYEGFGFAPRATETKT